MLCARGFRRLAASGAVRSRLPSAFAQASKASPMFVRSFNNFGEDDSSDGDSGSDGTIYKMELIEMAAIDAGVSPRDAGKVINSALDKIVAAVADEQK